MSTVTQKVDLHVHSPASVDFLGAKADSEYLSMLKECRRAGVSAIAITDHNTVNGCIAFERLKKEAQLNYELNSRRGGAKEFLEQLKDEMLLFESISMIHGVEVSVYPKLHLILLFDDEVRLEAINEFLKNDLDLGEVVEKGSPDSYFAQKPTALLSLATTKFGDKFFCILPHVDSSNGAWNELSGEPRAELFRAPEVLAVQVLSPETKRHFQKNIFQTRDYARRIPLQIIQASDFHGGSAGEIARQFSQLETGSRITFAALRQHFLHKRPVKISSDFIEETYKTLTDDKEKVSFEFQNGISVDDALETILAKAVCGCINTPNSMIEFNIKNSSLSPSEEADQIAKLIEERLILKIDPAVPFGFRISDLSHSPTRQRHILEQTRNTRLRMVDGASYLILNKQVIQAGAREVEQMVTRNLYNRFGRAKQQSLSQASNRLLMVANSFPAVSTAYRIDQLLDRQLLKKLNRKFEVPGYSKNLEDCVDKTNGVLEGDFYLLRTEKSLNAGRLSKHYLRFTAPMFLKRDVNTSDIKTITPPKDSIIVFPEGGIHFVEHSVPLYAPYPVLVISAKSEDEPISPKALMGLCVLLKSSFLLWYILTIHETDDVFEFLMRSFDRLPLPNDPKVLDALSGHGEKIINAEKMLLKDLCRGKLGDKEETALITNHNNESNAALRAADCDLMKVLQFSATEIREVSDALDDLRIADYELRQNLDEFIKSVTTRGLA